MSIKTVLQTFVSIAILMVLGNAVINWLIAARLANISLIQERAQTVSRDVSTLLVLTHDYSLYSEERAVLQWRALHASIVSRLEAETGGIVPVPPEAIKETKILPALFQQLVTTISNKSDLQNRTKGLLIDQLLTSTQILADSVHGWNHDSADYRIKIEREFHFFNLALYTAFFLILTFFSILIFFRVLRPLSKLHQAVLSAAKGDLTVRCATMSNDEFGELSRTFDAMALDLVSELRREIAVRIQSEEALQESEQAKSNLLASLNQAQQIALIGSWESNLCTNEVWWSDETYRIFGVTRQDFVPGFEANGKFIHPDDLASYSSSFQHSLQTGETLDVNIRLNLGDGELKHCQAKGKIISDDSGQPIRFVGTIMDISERKRYEQELQAKNTEMERFAYTVSHDLKSPLITIQAYVDMIKKNLETGRYERAQDDIKRIEGAAGKMTALLGDLLELSRAGRMMGEPSLIDMNRLVSDVLAQLTGVVKQSQVEVVVQPDLPAVHGDHKRIIQVVQNLIENAIKYRGDQTAPRIGIGSRQEGKEYIFYVSDNGKGIDPRHFEKIFDLFSKLDAKSEGTGVGLALVKRIIEVHGGRVWVESDGEGMGSCFCFMVGL